MSLSRKNVLTPSLKGAQNYAKLFGAQKITRNNTLNNVLVAATELPQPLSRIPTKYEYGWRGNITHSLSDFVQL